MDRQHCVQVEKSFGIVRIASHSLPKKKDFGFELFMLKNEWASP
jgi:hypothetical protein